MAKAKKKVPEGYTTVTPILTLDNARKAIDWYKEALGAKELHAATGPDGKVLHAEIQIGNARIMLHDVMPDGKGPKELGGSPAGLWLYVDDCDALFAQAEAAGGDVTVPLADQFWGDRFGVLADPFGYNWAIATHQEDLTPEELEKRQKDFMRKMELAGQSK